MQNNRYIKSIGKRHLATLLYIFALQGCIGHDFRYLLSHVLYITKSTLITSSSASHKIWSKTKLNVRTLKMFKCSARGLENSKNVLSIMNFV